MEDNEKKLNKLLNFADDSGLAMFDEIQEVNDTLDSLNGVFKGADFSNIDSLQGEQGIQGEKGDKGDKGEQGIQGIAGKQGQKGEKGDPGEDGLDGVDGIDGKDGKDGIEISAIEIREKLKGLSEEEKLKLSDLGGYDNLIKRLEAFGSKKFPLPQSGITTTFFSLNDAVIGRAKNINFTTGSTLNVTLQGDTATITVPTGGSGGLTQVAVTAPLSGDGTVGDPIQMDLLENHFYVGDSSNIASDAGTRMLWNPVNGALELNDGNNSVYIGGSISTNLSASSANTVVGFIAGNELHQAAGNTLIGVAAGRKVFDGNFNTLIGGGNMSFTTTNASYNVLVGYQSGRGLTADGNVMVGYLAGYNTGTAATHTILIGRESDSGAVNNSIALGYQAIVSASNTFVVGGTGANLIPNWRINGVDYVMPSADGSAGNQLTTDGFGNLSWSSGGGGGTLTGITGTSPVTIDNTIPAIPNISIVGTPTQIAYYADTTGLQTSDAFLTRNVPDDRFTFSSTINNDHGIFYNGTGAPNGLGNHAGIGMDFFGGADTYTFGASGVGNGTLLNVNDATQVVKISSGGNDYLQIFPLLGEYHFGDASQVANKNEIFINDSGNEIKFNQNGGNTLLFQQGSGTYSIGDISTLGNGLTFTVNDAGLFMNLSLPYVNTRDDTGSFFPTNFLYTNAVGDLFSAPLTTIIPSGGGFLIGATSGRISNPSALSTQETFFGEGAGGGGASKNDTVFIGRSAGSGATSADNAIAIGRDSLSGSVDAGSAVAIGYQALGALGALSGSTTIAIGASAGYSATGLNGSIVIGSSSGSGGTQGDNVILIGTGTSSGGFSNSIGLGYQTQVTAANQFIVDPSGTLTNITLESSGLSLFGDSQAINNSTTLKIDDPNESILAGDITNASNGYVLSINNTIPSIGFGNLFAGTPSLVISGNGSGSNIAGLAGDNVSIGTATTNLVGLLMNDTNDVFSVTDFSLDEGIFFYGQNGVGFAGGKGLLINTAYSAGLSQGYYLGNTESNFIHINDATSISLFLARVWNDGAPIFTGSGLDDLTYSDNTFQADTTVNYTITINSSGTPDTFDWSDDQGNSAANVPIAGANTVSFNVNLTFGSTTGHTPGDSWTIQITQSKTPLMAYSGNLRKVIIGDVSSFSNSTTVTVDDRIQNIDINGGLSLNQISTGSNVYNVSEADYYIDLVTGAATVNLPDISTLPAGKTYVFKDADGSSAGGAFVITAFGPDLIDGAATYTINTAWESITIHSNGQNWLIS